MGLPLRVTSAVSPRRCDESARPPTPEGLRQRGESTLRANTNFEPRGLCWQLSTRKGHDLGLEDF
jgi:hypothetical protein